jgi:hypothetical protein
MPKCSASPATVLSETTGGRLKFTPTLTLFIKFYISLAKGDKTYAGNCKQNNSFFGFIFNLHVNFLFECTESSFFKREERIDFHRIKPFHKQSFP